MNQYELMCFNQPEELMKKIKSLVEKQLKTNGARECDELKEISKYIGYSVTISETVSFECDEPHDTGDGSWGSIEEYLDTKENFDMICSQAEASKYGVRFASNSEWGTFDFNGDTEVEINDIWLEDECSAEALERQMEEHQKKRIEEKQKQIQLLEEQLLKLKAAQ